MAAEHGRAALVSPLTGGKVTGCRFAKNDGRVGANLFGFVIILIIVTFVSYGKQYGKR